MSLITKQSETGGRPSWRLSALSSFRAQSNDRIHSCRAARGQPRGDECDDGDEQNNSYECRRIGCADSEKKAVKQPRGGKRTGQADYETDSNECHCLANDEPEDGGLPGAQRHTDSKLVRSLGDGVSQHAVDSDRCQEQRGAGENREQQGVET